MSLRTHSRTAALGYMVTEDLRKLNLGNGECQSSEYVFFNNDSFDRSQRKAKDVSVEMFA